MSVRDTAWSWRSVMPVTALAAGLLLAGIPSANAESREKCRREIEKAELRLDNAIRLHGENSRQANHRRFQLNEHRERCWTQHHGWWSSRDHRWRDDRDWERDDRDHRSDHDHSR